MTDKPQAINTLLSASEVTLGLILIGKQTATNFNPEKFSPKYGAVLKDIKSGKTKEELYVKYANLLQPCEYAAKSVNGLGDEMDWVKVMDEAYSNELIRSELDKMSRQIEMGDLEKFDDSLRRVQATRKSSQRLRSVTADEISDDYIPFMKSGATAWDTHFGGFPTVGVILVAAKTFTGKTTIALSLSDEFLREYDKKEILFVTLEDMAEGWKERARTMFGERSKDFWKRIHVMEFAGSPDEIIEEASRFENIGLIVVDYIDYLAKDKDLSSYENIYKTLSMGSKSLAVSSKFKSMPVLLLAQFGKGAYQGGVPELKSLLYTGEQYAYQIVMLYHADGDYYADNEESSYVLPSEKGTGFLVAWKIKNGCRPHIDEFPGAVKVPWTPRYGFNISADGVWYSLASETKQKVKKKR